MTIQNRLSLFWNRNKSWVGLTFFWTSTAFVIPLLFPKISPISLLAWFGVDGLILTLLPNNLLSFSVIQTSCLARPLLFLVRFRRSIGITTGLLLVFHGLTAFTTELNLQIHALFLSPIRLGLMVLMIIFLLLATSNTTAQRVLGTRWKYIHRLIWLALPLAFTHSLLASTTFRGRLSFVGGIGLGAILAYVILENILALRLPAPPPARRLHLLYSLIGALLTIILMYS